MCNFKHLKQTGYLIAALLLQILCSHAIANTALNGLSIHSQLGKEQFIAGLSVTTLSSSSRAILLSSEEKQIQVRVLTDRISARSFKRMWIEGMAINASSSELTQHAQQMADFSNLLKIKLIAGDIFTIERSSDNVTVLLNGIKLGEIPDVTFFDLLLRTWIGPVPLSSDFRDNLLAEGSIDEGLRSRFDSITPTDERVALVQQSLRNIKKRIPLIASTVPAVSASTAPAIAAPPQIVAPAPTIPEIPEPAAPVDVVTAVEPTAAPEEEAPQLALLDADLMDEEEEDLDFTAESLLSQQLYIASLKRWSNNYLSYPKRALERSWQGNVRLSITVDRGGKVNSVEIIEEAKHPTLTKAAVKAAKKASPFPPMPDSISGNDFTFTLPVVFRLTN